MSTPTPTNTNATGEETSDLSKQYDTPLGLAHTTMQALKDRIKLHYDLASDYYLNLWGEHIHHGYWPTDASKAADTKETAQLNLIRLLLTISSLPVPVGEEEEEDSLGTTNKRNTTTPLRILDVGCGVGGTTRYLASILGATVTGITISSKQVQIATRLSKAAAAPAAATPTTAAAAAAAEDGEEEEDDSKDDGFIPVGEKGGKVRFIELDAERMGEFFATAEKGFDVVWITEALSHFPNKALFFRNAFQLLRAGGGSGSGGGSGGKLVLADWFRAEGLGEGGFEGDIKPIEDGMLLPPLCTQQQYVDFATGAGLALVGEPKDISKDVSKTWDISWSLVQNPSLWAFAFSQGRDGIAFLQAFRAMRRGYANGSFRYAVMSFVKQ
ncbi:S-adenosyl-L-methionine-dependent methyltransferase [Chaetomidium leptoderma]|uniref:S-adenosyl-L-methionine-dependent methyltransferase n=1 Tax=Chaetomidium leptoderma TaxID=669021 RepID=A0AAN6VHW0_9PEZI|nr:S-adenosyl-L-methionine-dependent methyltransferase [Chaetomidium leptoderma]